MTGKNTRTAAIRAFESGLISPNQLLIRGANAMIGTALAPTASGSRMPRAVTKRAATNATAEAGERADDAARASASWSGRDRGRQRAGTGRRSSWPGARQGSPRASGRRTAGG